MKILGLALAVCFTPALILNAGSGVRDLNTLRTFPDASNRAEWEKRAQKIREHVLVSCGFWPLPEKAPLNARIFGRVERDGYAVEKVYFETSPGFYLAGNLYRPLGKGEGPFPGVLNPHGHWPNGRLVDTETGSIAARCISFARQGMVAFSYDMIGYNDTTQVRDHRTFATHPTNLLWNISLMGVQTWNSIRALDFLEGLPDVDKTRLACTGESGGGTQTFMLGAIDARLAVQAPIVMVSHSMQGGCLCENAPGLRVDYSNMEIAAAAAPRPQILVAATGDWTRKTMTVEGPAIEKVYELFGAKQRFFYTIFDFGHNYNKTSREAVYRWFGKWLLRQDDPEKLREASYAKESDNDLRVFPDGRFPEGARTEAEFLSSLVQQAQEQVDRSFPRDAQAVSRWKSEWLPAWEHSVQLQHVRADSILAEEANGSESSVRLKRAPEGLELSLSAFRSERPRAVVIISSAGDEDPEGARKFAQAVRDEGCTVLRLTHESVPSARNQFTNFFSTYNRTILQERAAELKVAAQYAREKFKDVPVLAVGRGSAGLAALAAAPLFDGVSADCSALDDSKDENLLDLNVFFPGLRRLGSLEGIAALAAPHPLLLHNTAGKLRMKRLPPLYVETSSDFRYLEERASEQVLAEWVKRAARRD